MFDETYKIEKNVVTVPYFRQTPCILQGTRTDSNTILSYLFDRYIYVLETFKYA